MAIRQALKKALLLVPALLMAQGCTLLPVNKEAQAGKPNRFVRKIHKSGRMPCQIVSTWKNEVLHVADPVQGGVPAPGLAGRFYLFGEEVDTPIEAEGTLHIDLYDLGKGQGGQAVLLENWQVDPATLKRLKRKDPVGEGYTLFLPWGTYREDITRVQLKLRYDAGGEFPLYGDTGPLTLNNEITFRHSKATVAPGSAQPPVQGLPGIVPPPGTGPVGSSSPATRANGAGALEPTGAARSGPAVSRTVVPTGAVAASHLSTGTSGPAAGARTTRLTIEPVDFNPPKAEGFGPGRVEPIGQRSWNPSQTSGAAAPAPEAPAGPRVWNLR